MTNSGPVHNRNYLRGPHGERRRARVGVAAQGNLFRREDRGFKAEVGALDPTVKADATTSTCRVCNNVARRKA
jgi:hypothetical protein